MNIILVSTIDGKHDEGMKNVASGIAKGLRCFSNISLLCLKPRNILNISTLRKIKHSDHVLICLRANKKVYNLCRFLHHFNKKISFVFCQPPTADFIRLNNKKNILFRSFSLRQNYPYSDSFFLKFPINDLKFKPLGLQKTKDSVLSVGHLTQGRNALELLNIPNKYNITFVSSIDDDTDVRNALLNKGVKIIDSYLPNIETEYNRNEIYLFPTINLENVIFIPISILEAASCGLPIVMNKNFPCLDLIENYLPSESIFLYEDSNDLLFAIENASKYIESGKCNRLLSNTTWKNEVGRMLVYLEENRNG